MILNVDFHRSILIVTFVACVVLDKAEAEIKSYTCMVDHLRSLKLLDKDFRYRSTSTSSESSQCQSDIEEYRGLFYEAMESELKGDEDLSENVDCLIEQFKNINLAEVSMKKSIYQNSRAVSQRKRKKFIKAIEFSLEKKMSNAIKMCTFEQAFGEAFDEFFGKDPEKQEEPEGEEEHQVNYCLKKHMVDKGFINTTVYNLDLNPKNIDISELNCDKYIEAAVDEAVDLIKEEFEEELELPSKRFMRCITKTAREGNFLEISLRVQILSDLKISKELQVEERSHYIESMKGIYDRIMKC